MGTGLRVLDVISALKFAKRSPAQIASDYDLTLAQVYATLAYYYEQQAEVGADIRQGLIEGMEFVAEGFGRPEKSIFPVPSAEELAVELQEALEQARQQLLPNTAEDLLMQ